ncbi:MAG: hypothetical protein HKN14_12995 [Marinicaulis sp.]|nr:hypothetical protein [Marinicaulis sp.]NNE41821.1 hypothetical protein [Marinicaulis sp.]NNL90325.1 hypothetical protein [Marinicaulis sp.]
MRKFKIKKIAASVTALGFTLILAQPALSDTLPAAQFAGAKIPATSMLFALGLGLIFLKLRHEE